MYIRGRTAALLIVFSILCSSLLTAAAFGAGESIASIFFGSVPASKSADGLEDGLEKLQQTYNLIKREYIRDVDDQKLIDGAISGMVEALDDPYSVYMDQETAKQFHSALESSFEGIGAEVTMKNGRVTIVSPFKGSPAEKAGLRPEDQVIKVNDVSLEGMTLNEAVMKIRGPKGTKAKLEVVRPGHSEILHITVVRDEIPIETVDAQMLKDGIGKIEISQFAEDTADDFSSALKELEKQGIKGLIIDLRGNPGGLLPAVLEIAEELVPGQKPIMFTEDKRGQRVEYKSKRQEPKPYPIVLLIDKGSASASEILAAAMKESGGYTLVGQPTFGKGTVQTAKDFDDGSNLKMTMAKWLTPKGNWIDQKGGTKGVKPDVTAKPPAFAQATPPMPEKPLKRDMASPEVRNLQLILDGMGYSPGRTDGYYSERTELAVKAFQKTRKLPVTGQVDQKTALKLQEEFLKLLRDPKSDIQLQVAVDVLKKQMK
ncbi:MAG: S41 family peptidase [Planifilum sp.]|jgi:carboxyl-terminal processing protease